MQSLHNGIFQSFIDSVHSERIDGEKLTSLSDDDFAYYGLELQQIHVLRKEIEHAKEKINIFLTTFPQT